MLDLNSHSFDQMNFGLSIVALVLGLALIVFTFAIYSRGRDVYGDTAEKQRWTLLMGTWRDSLLITVLYVSESLMYRYMDFVSYVPGVPGRAALTAPVVVSLTAFVLSLLIFGIATMRTFVISKWLAAQRDNV